MFNEWPWILNLRLEFTYGVKPSQTALSLVSEETQNTTPCSMFRLPLQRKISLISIKWIQISFHEKHNTEKVINAAHFISFHFKKGQDRVSFVTYTSCSVLFILHILAIYVSNCILRVMTGNLHVSVFKGIVSTSRVFAFHCISAHYIYLFVSNFSYSFFYIVG